MCTHPFAKEALTLHLARSEGHERYFGCNLMHRNVLASHHQHLMTEAPSNGFPMGGGKRAPHRPLTSLRRRLDAVFPQNIGDGVPGSGMAEIREGHREFVWVMS